MTFYLRMLPRLTVCPTRTEMHTQSASLNSTSAQFSKIEHGLTANVYSNLITQVLTALPYQHPFCADTHFRKKVTKEEHFKIQIFNVLVNQTTHLSH